MQRCTNPAPLVATSEVSSSSRELPHGKVDIELPQYLTAFATADQDRRLRSLKGIILYFLNPPSERDSRRESDRAAAAKFTYRRARVATWLQ
jgi:hypothetical protein